MTDAAIVVAGYLAASKAPVKKSGKSSAYPICGYLLTVPG